MELFTDILAILGWALLGDQIPSWIAIYSGQRKSSTALSAGSFTAFGLIAASLVLG